MRNPLKVFSSFGRREKARSFDEIIALLDSNGFGTASGKSITTDSAMNQATVWACIRIISETIAQLPISVQVRESGKWVEAETHDVAEILHAPNGWMGAHDLISFMVMWAELVGNSYFFKTATSRGKITSLLPIEADVVDATQNSNWSIKYLVQKGSSISGDFPQEKILHHRNFGRNGFTGYSTITNSREGIGLAIRLEEYGATQFKNGLSAGTWIEAKYPLSQEALDSLKTSIREYESSSNAGKTFYTQGDLQLHQLDAMSAVDAQYLESRRFQKQEIASWFGVPLFLLNDTEKSTTWGSGLEQLSRAFVRFSLNPRLSRLNQTLVRELVPKAERPNTRIVFDTDAFTLGEFKERMDGYRSAIESGVLNPNECREIEGRNERDGGDEFRLPANISVEGDEPIGDENETTE